MCTVCEKVGETRRRPMASYGESRGDTVVKEFLKHICGLRGVSVSCDCVVHSGYRVDMSLNLSKSAYVSVTELILYFWLAGGFKARSTRQQRSKTTEQHT